MQFKPVHSALILVLLATPLLNGCHRDANLTEQERIQRAKDFEDKGDYKASIIELKNALQKKPDSPQARLMLGEIYIKNGMGAAAETELLKAKALGVSDETIKVPLAKALLAQYEFKRVRDEISPSAETSPTNRARLLQLKGEAQLGLGNLDQACALYAESQRLDTRYIPAYLGLAKCAVAKGDIAQARANIALAHQIDAKDVDSWLLQGELEIHLNNLKGAAAAYSQALKIAPGNLLALSGHATALLSLNDLSGAIKDIDTASKLAPGSIAVKYLQGLLNYHQGKFDVARDKAQDILRTTPENISAVLLLGLSENSLGQYEIALSNFDKVLTQQPGNTGVRKMLAEALIRTGQSQRALTTLQPLLLQSTADSQSLSLAASAYANLGQFDKAIPLFQNVLKNQPDDTGLRISLARALLAAGKNDQAITVLQPATQHDTPDYDASKMLVSTLLQQRQYAAALAIARTLQTKLPNKALPYNMEGAVFLAQRDLVNARANFNRAAAAEPNEPAAALNLAQLDIAENKLKNARIRIEKLLQANPKNLQALLLQADVEHRSGNEAAYVKLLKDALTAAPNALSARLQLMRYYLDNNQTQTALAYARDGYSSAAGDPQFLDLMGQIQLAAGEADNAVATYTRLVQIIPNATAAQIGLAAAQAAANNLKASRQALTAALKLNPDNAEALAAMAMLEARSNNVPTARKYAHTLQTRYPKSPVGFALEGDIMLGLGKAADAAALYEKAYTLAPSGNIALSLFKAYYRAGNKTMAYEKIGDWLKAHPDDYLTRAYLASAYKTDGQYKEAALQDEYILGKLPDNYLVMNELALIYAQLGDARALPMAERAYKFKPDSPAIGDTYGWILVNAGQADKGLAILRKAAASGLMGIRYHLAQALAKTGNRVAARRELEDMQRANKPFAQSAQANDLLQELSREK